MHTPIPDIHHGIERPIIKAIICQLRDAGVVPNWDKYSFQPVLNKRNNANEKYPFMFKSDNFMEVTADIKQADGLNVPNPLSSYQSGILPIFLDQNTRVALQPVYNKMYVEIELKFHTLSNELLRQWRTILRENHMLGADRWTHKVQYAYRVPGRCGELIEYVHKAIEAKAGYGDDLATYVHKHMIQGTSIASGGNYIQLSINELETNVTGYMSNELEIDSQDDQYIGTTTYKVWFDMPRSIISIYDVQVHQSLLPKKYLPMVLDKPSNIGILKNQDRTLLEPIKPFDDIYAYKEISITPFDDSLISDPPKAYRVVWRALLTLDTGMPGEVLCNLRDLPRLCMPEWMFCIIKNFKDECVLPYTGPLLFSLHRGDDLMDVTHLKIDDNLNLITKQELNLRDNWHITLSVAMAPQKVVGTKFTEMCEVCPMIKEPLKELVIKANTGFVKSRINLARVREDGICTSPGLAMYTVESAIIQTFTKQSKALRGKQNKIRS